MKITGGDISGYKLISDRTLNSMKCWLDGKITQSNPATGSTWTDLSGNGNHLTIDAGLVTLGSGGLSITNDVTNLTEINPDLLDLTNYSLEFFFKRTAADAGYLMLIEEGGGGSDYRIVTGNENNFSFIEYNFTGTSVFSHSSRTLTRMFIYFDFQVGPGRSIIYNNQEGHIIITYNNSTKQFYSYINGKKILPYIEFRFSSGSIEESNNGILPAEVTYNPPSSIYDNITLGGKTSLGFTGLINLFRVYNRPLTDAEVLNNYYALIKRNI